MSEYLKKESQKDNHRRHFVVVPQFDDQWIVTLHREQTIVDSRTCHADHIQTTMDIMLEDNL